MRSETVHGPRGLAPAQEVCLIVTPNSDRAGGQPESGNLASSDNRASNGGRESATGVVARTTANGETSPVYEVFTVPHGASYLTSRAGRPRFSSAATDASGGGLVVEPLQLGADWCLVVARPRAHTLRANGVRAPRVQALRVGDQLQIDPGFVLHVTVFRQPRVGRAGQERVGSECLLCRTPLEMDAFVYTCANCGGSLHHENGDARSATRETPLACASLCKTCPSCGKTVVLESGYEFVPNPI